MGKKGGWFSAVKKVLTFDSKNTKKNKLYKKNSTAERAVAVVPPVTPKASEANENEQNKQVYSAVNGNEQNKQVYSAVNDNEQNTQVYSTVNENEQNRQVHSAVNKNAQNRQIHSAAIANAAATEAAAANTRAAVVEVARLSAATIESRKLNEYGAAVMIQSGFRAHLARKELRKLRGLARLKSMIKGQSVQRQSMITLQCMRTLSNVQSQVRSRRITMFEQNQALQQQLQQKCEKESAKPKAPASTTYSGDGWNTSAVSKEEMEAKLRQKEESAIRREKALAYAYSHQNVRKKSSKLVNSKPEYPTFINQTDWGWSWLERWATTRPWENQTAQYPQPTDHENTSKKRNKTRVHTPKPKTLPSPPRSRSVGPKTRPPALPEHKRRHSIAVVKDFDNTANSRTVSSDGPVKSRVNMPSRLGIEKAEKRSSIGVSKKQFSSLLSEVSRQSVPV